jgi:hypothetical protein
VAFPLSQQRAQINIAPSHESTIAMVGKRLSSEDGYQKTVNIRIVNPAAIRLTALRPFWDDSNGKC